MANIYCMFEAHKASNPYNIQFPIYTILVTSVEWP